MSDIRLSTGQLARLVTPVDTNGSPILGGSGGTIVLAVFRAIGAGTGYSIDDIIILRQTPPAAAEYFNATTGSIIATPLPADLGSVSSASNVSIVSALPSGTNTIGAISNSGFGITGTLPAYATTPTFNIGTSALALESGGNLAGINTKLPSGLAVSSGRLLVDGSGVTQPVSLVSPTPAFEFTATITRAANTTAYTANDVYGNAIELISSVVPPSGIWLIITDIDIIFNLTALPTGMGGFQLYPYNVTPPSAIGDNGAFSTPSGDRASLLYSNGISLGNASLSRGGGSVVTQANNINVAIKLTGTSLFAYNVTLGGFTPAANSETATIRVRAIAL